MVAMVAFLVLAMLRVLVFRPELTTSPEARRTVTVRHVIDGDTFDLTDGRRIRMLGIDAPEAGFNGKVAQPYSAESAAWLRDRIEGRRVEIRMGDEEKDRYDRTLAWVFDTEGILINQQMLAEGQAKLLPDFGLPPDLEPSLREAESEARLLKRGLWGKSLRHESR
jgi:micrococcal nuclease